ncbi:MAG: maltose alpha-D-glucosyltransferase [Actinomycetota bacterium]|nr:maltose alpha-D-glucosyltransferase [Actinomycetota bacterium]MDA2980797.1 maltose alpha-D-glucosyltransferase [Actinomycetota bacterium]MDA3002422.1 maltose alpha-D-glucosyltransferase [Actinomycetota bacterium]
MDFRLPPAHRGLEHDPQWYRRAVFYEVMVRSFYDSDGDGVGDIVGLISKLDYLEWLGIDALWLPPFYSSPLKDGGYDVADYRQVLPEFGTIEDFQELVTQAHARNMRVVMDLPINHTSVDHEWFQQSRSDPDGPYGDYYVWSDTDQIRQQIRVIFTDTEVSNWAFDSERRQFFFHRFFSHQPDLNYHNPKVHEEVREIARFWLAMGVDGFRLDAIPYLYESDEGSGESEPETHEFLRNFRAFIDEEFPGRVLIAEANQWPKEVAAYLGTNEDPECHMAFDFPIMPRIFYALRSQQTASLNEVLSETTEVPTGAAWGVFLRNHDELTLEMVTDEEKQALYGWYAYDPRMRVNVGIRRRLAPLLDNSRKELELAHGLLLSLPGSPFLYYGDEIGMGDNIWLEDRDSSRTPMQWTPDRNAGFSATDPGKLYLPVVQSLVYHYAFSNVETQLAQQASLLHWVRNLVHLRKEHPVLGVGSLRIVPSDNPSALAFVRDMRAEDCRPGERPETMLCVYSFAHHPISVDLQLPEEFRANKVTDVMGGSSFPTPSEQGRMTLTLAAQSFYWLSLAGVKQSVA